MKHALDAAQNLDIVNMRSFLLASILAVAAVQQAMAATTFPEALATNEKEFWRVFMREIYGPYDPTRKCWIGTKGTDRFCMRPNTLNRVTQNGATSLYLTAAGKLDSESPQDCLNCTGNIGFFVLVPENGSLTISAQSGLFDEAGVNGNAPGGDDLQLAQASADGTHAWLAKARGLSRGINFENVTLYAPVGKTIAELGTLPLYYNDSDSDCFNVDTNSGDGCSDYTVGMRLDLAKPGRFAPVLLTVQGNIKTKPINQSFVATFDDKTMTYQLPKDFPADN